MQDKINIEKLRVAWQKALNMKKKIDQMAKLF